jgi:putative ABC transport system ATP-binding protein
VSAVLELAGVTKEYPGSPPVRALDQVSLAVTAGELTGIVGPSGSGKTTLLHLMGTLDKPTAGIVRVTGLDVRRLRDRLLRHRPPANQALHRHPGTHEHGAAPGRVTGA